MTPSFAISHVLMGITLDEACRRAASLTSSYVMYLFRSIRLFCVATSSQSPPPWLLSRKVYPSHAPTKDRGRYLEAL